MSFVNDKQRAVELLEKLDAAQFAAIFHLLEVMADPVARAVSAALPDDEPLTEEDARRFHDGQKWFAQRGGRGVPMEEVLADFGLRREDFDLSRVPNSKAG